MVSDYNKIFVRNGLIKLLDDLTKQNVKFIIIACHSASSCILDILIKNNSIYNNIKIFEPIIPTCLYIKKNNYKNILILSTNLTSKIKWHYRLLLINNPNIIIKYLTLPSLVKIIENNYTNYNDKINNSLQSISKQKDFIKICECVVLGCTHYNIIENLIKNELKRYGFNGIILNSNKILLQYFIKNKN